MSNLNRSLYMKIIYKHQTFSMIVVNPVWVNIFALAYLHNHNIHICQIIYKLVKTFKPSTVTYSKCLKYVIFTLIS